MDLLFTYILPSLEPSISLGSSKKLIALPKADDRFLVNIIDLRRKAKSLFSDYCERGVAPSPGDYIIKDYQ